MHVFLDCRRLTGSARWGVFTNLDSSTASRTDRADGFWYLHLHTPLAILQLYRTTDGLSFAYWGKRYYTTQYSS